MGKLVKLTRHSRCKTRSAAKRVSVRSTANLKVGYLWLSKDCKQRRLIQMWSDSCRLYARALILE